MNRTRAEYDAEVEAAMARAGVTDDNCHEEATYDRVVAELPADIREDWNRLGNELSAAIRAGMAEDDAAGADDDDLPEEPPLLDTPRGTLVTFVKGHSSD